MYDVVRLTLQSLQINKRQRPHQICIGKHSTCADKIVNKAIEIEKSPEVTILSISDHHSNISSNGLLKMNKVLNRSLNNNGDNQMSSFLQDILKDIHKEMQNFSNLLTHLASFINSEDNASTAAVVPTAPPSLLLQCLLNKLPSSHLQGS